MSANSSIEWCKHTFNGWWGCEKVSEACKFCYAERMSARWGNDLWGPNKPRKIASDKYWMKPFAWYKSAVRLGEFHRVFVNSMSDVGEDREDLVQYRDRLLALAALTAPYHIGTENRAGLVWLWLTKRPDVLARYFADPGLYQRVLDAAQWFRSRRPPLWLSSVGISDPANLGGFYPHVWVGTTVENQEQANIRIPQLLKVPASVRFLSCEPLLGPLNLHPWLCQYGDPTKLHQRMGPCCRTADGLSWVICGGESGPKARPMHPDWVRRIRDDCVAAGVPFHFKQWGAWVPHNTFNVSFQEWQKLYLSGRQTHVCKSHGDTGPMSTPQTFEVYRVGKKKAGRLLAGRTWDQVPELSQ